MQVHQLSSWERQKQDNAICLTHRALHWRTAAGQHKTALKIGRRAPCGSRSSLSRSVSTFWGGTTCSRSHTLPGLIRDAGPRSGLATPLSRWYTDDGCLTSAATALGVLGSSGTVVSAGPVSWRSNGAAFAVGSIAGSYHWGSDASRGGAA
jgi:hypothetical protein